MFAFWWNITKITRHVIFLMPSRKFQLGQKKLFVSCILTDC